MSAPAERPLRVLVVDDEEPARQLLADLLAEIGGCELVGSCANGFEALRTVPAAAPDVLLLDVRMPKLDGFEVVELLDPGPAVIFVTAFEEHALRAFEVHAVDYLLKPVAGDRLAAALERARVRLAAAAAGNTAAATPSDAAPTTAGGGGAAPERSSALRREVRGAAPRDRIVVREGAAVTVIPVDRLDYAEAADDYVVLHVGARSHRKQQTLAELEAELDPQRFVRIHRSLLLNLDRLARLEPYAKDSRVAFLHDGRRLPVSRAGYERLRELL
jgi:two-component system LytT family response regulator